MKKDYYEYHVPHSDELQSMFYRVTTVDKRSIDAVKHIMSLHPSKDVKDVFMKHSQRHRLYSMAKPAIAVYGYYINYPNRFNNNPDNIAGWMIKRMISLMLNYSNYNETQDQYHKLPNSFVTKHKDFILRELERDAKIVAAKAWHIESQRID